jgi:hypothetical protein
MVLTSDDIKKFQAIYLDQFGTDISEEDAYEQGIKLLTLMKIIHKPMTHEEMERVQEHRRATAHLLQR